MQRPSFSDLTLAEQQQFGNGVGPYWLPAWARRAITGAASWFFKSANWQHHDFGYAVGGDRWDRARCDWKFFTAMLRDISALSGQRLFLIPPALFFSLMFYVAVRIGGPFGSFKYRKSYATLSEVRNSWAKGCSGSL